MSSTELTAQNRMAAGIFTFVHRISDTVVRKVPKDDELDKIQSVRNEANIYALLGRHERIAVCLSVGHTDHVDIKWTPNGTLDQYIRENRESLTDTGRLRLFRQVVEAVAYVHSNGVIHSDLRLDQFLVDEDHNARLSDFGASGYGGEPALGVENASHYLPRDPDLPNTIKSDLFALGSTLYELMAGKCPYEDKQDGEIENLYKQGRFPSTDTVPGGHIILGCWQGQFNSADAVLDAFGKTAQDIQKSKSFGFTALTWSRLRLWRQRFSCFG